MKSRAFSLIEIMLAMGLIFLVFGLISVLVKNYSEVSAHAGARDDMQDSVIFALQKIRSEVAGAIRIQTPGGEPPVKNLNKLEFVRINPAARDIRLHLTPEIAPVDVNIDPWNDQSWETLSFQSDAVTEKLSRTSSVTGQATLLAKGINTFEVSRPSQDFMTLTLSFKDEKRAFSYTLGTKLWCLSN